MWLEKIGLQSLSPIFEIKIIASYSKMQEAHLYAKFKGQIYTLYIGISMQSLRDRFTRRILVSSSDNKSVSNWIMFDYFFHV